MSFVISPPMGIPIQLSPSNILLSYFHLLNGTTCTITKRFQQCKTRRQPVRTDIHNDVGSPKSTVRFITGHSVAKVHNP